MWLFVCIYAFLDAQANWPSLINPYNTALLRGKLEAENISLLQIGSRCSDLVVLSGSAPELHDPA